MRNILFLIFLCVVISCQKEINQENRIKEDVTFLASDELEGRQTGTEGEKKAADYISKRFKELKLSEKGTKGFLQPFTFKPKTNPHEEVKFDVNGDGTITGNNVIGFLDNQASNTIIIGAHYDHLGKRGRKIYNGADDNASGVAALLVYAKEIAEMPLKHSVIFLFTDGEEVDLLGAKAFVKKQEFGE